MPEYNVRTDALIEGLRTCLPLAARAKDSATRHGVVLEVDHGTLRCWSTNNHAATRVVYEGAADDAGDTLRVRLDAAAIGQIARCAKTHAPPRVTLRHDASNLVLRELSVTVPTHTMEGYPAVLDVFRDVDTKVRPDAVAPIALAAHYLAGMLDAFTTRKIAKPKNTAHAIVAHYYDTYDPVRYTCAQFPELTVLIMPVRQ